MEPPDPQKPERMKDEVRAYLVPITHAMFVKGGFTQRVCAPPQTPITMVLNYFQHWFSDTSPNKSIIIVINFYTDFFTFSAIGEMEKRYC